MKQLYKQNKMKTDNYRLTKKEQLEIEIGETLYFIDGMFMTMSQALIYKLNIANQQGQ